MKKVLALLAIIVLSFSFFIGCREKSEIDLSNVPDYLKEIYPTLISEGIKVNYNPYVGDDIKMVPESQKELQKEKIPSSWIKGHIELPSSEHIETFSMSQDNKGYLITRKRIFAGADYKDILNLYKINDGTLSFIETLDKAPNKENASGGVAGNFLPQINGNFVVWVATPDASDTIGPYEIWAYNISKREFFKITSYKDEFTHFETFSMHCVLDDPCDPLFKLYPDNKLIVQTVFENTESKTYFTRIKLYNLSTGEDETLVLSKDYNYMVEIRGYNSALAYDTLFVTRCKLYQTPDENKKFASYTDIANREVVQIDLKTKQVSPFIPRHFIVYGSLNNKILLVAFDPNYAYHDVWLYNPKDKTLDCVLKMPVEKTDEENYFLLTPKINLLNKGLIYFRFGLESIIPQHYFSFNKWQLFYIGNFVLSDNNFALSDGNCLLVYNETENNNASSKEKITYLLVKPE